MKKIQQFHDRICEEFIKGNIPKSVFLLLDKAIERIKSNPLYEFFEN